MPVLTVLDARGTLYRRVGTYAALADLDDALSRSARMRGVTPAATTRLVDADLTSFDVDDLDPFLDVAELRAWESVLANATEPALRDAAIDESPSAVRDLARERIKALAAYVKDVHGAGLSPLGMGTIGLDFQAGGLDDDEFFNY